MIGDDTDELIALDPAITLRLLCLSALVLGCAHPRSTTQRSSPETAEAQRLPVAECNQIEVGAARVHVATVPVASGQTGIFRLSVTFAGAASPAPSTFLSDQPVPVACVAQKTSATVQTAAGSLSIDANGKWQLRDEAKKIVAAGDILAVKGNQTLIYTDVSVPFRAYGTSNPSIVEGGLQQTAGASGLGNGWAVIPYYWSTAGYGVLGVSQDDDRPASWTAASGRLTWTFSGQSADLYLMPARDLYQAARSYADLTGHAPIPPKWTFGYLQSRWGWGCGQARCPNVVTRSGDVGRADIDSTLEAFRRGRFPVDAFIFDFESFAALEDFPSADYTLDCDGDPRYHDFAWNPILFPQPREQIATYRKQGLRIVAIRKPRIGDSVELSRLRAMTPPAANGCTEALKHDVNGRFLHFINPAVRSWYAHALEPMLADGVAGWWNDEGEATYSTYYYWNLSQMMAEQASASSRQQLPARHWSLNRAFSPGLQRLGAATWSGDNRSNWKALQQTPVNMLSWSLAGMPYGATDLGGFVGAELEDRALQQGYAELVARWMEVGVFLPVMRSHSTRIAEPHFPWLAGPYQAPPDPRAVNAIRNALNLRYRFIPYYYSLARGNYLTGAPLMRPLVMEFPGDPKVAAMTDQWLMGRGLMVAPVLAPGDRRQVYFPEPMQTYGRQEHFDGGKSYQVTAALDEIPMFVRAGTILPLAPAATDSDGVPPQHTDQLTDGPLELQIYPGKDGSFTLYEDDGNSYAYQSSSAAYRETTFDWDDGHRTLRWRQRGSFDAAVFHKLIVKVVDTRGTQTAGPALTLGASGSLQVPR